MVASVAFWWLAAAHYVSNPGVYRLGRIVSAPHLMLCKHFIAVAQLRNY